MLILDLGGDGTHTDTHGSNEDEGIVLLPQQTYFLAVDDRGTQISL